MAARLAIVSGVDGTSAYASLVHALIRLGRSAEAVQAARVACESAPDHAISHYNLARALHSHRDWVEALTEAQVAVRLAPSDSNAHNLLGICLRSRGRRDQAHAAFEQALALDPSNGYALNNLAALDMASGRLTRALATLRSAMSVNPGLRLIRDTLDSTFAALYARLGWATLACVVGTVLLALAGSPDWLRALLPAALVVFLCWQVAAAQRQLPPGVHLWGNRRHRSKLVRNREGVLVLGLGLEAFCAFAPLSLLAATWGVASLLGPLWTLLALALAHLVARGPAA